MLWAFGMSYLAFAVIIVQSTHLSQLADSLKQLEKDKETPTAVCEELNPSIKQLFAMSALSSLLMAISKDWLLCVANTAVVAWLLFRISKTGSFKLFDPTDIMQYKVLQSHKQALKYLLYYTIGLGILLFGSIVFTLVQSLHEQADLFFNSFGTIMESFALLFSAAKSGEL